MQDIARLFAQLNQEIMFARQRLQVLAETRSDWVAMIEEQVGSVIAGQEAESERRRQVSALSCFLKGIRHFPSLPRSSRSDTIHEPLGSSVEPTTLTVRNVPARYTQEELLKEWAPYHTFDFLYLPFSHQKKSTTGCAYINFASKDAALDFVRRWHGRFLKKHRSQDRPLNIVFASLQGYQANVEKAVSLLEKVRNESIMPALYCGGARVLTRPVLEAARASMQVSVDSVDSGGDTGARLAGPPT